MNRNDIMRAVKLRLKFMDIMDFPVAENFNELIEMVESDTDLISQFKGSDTSVGELKTILVGLCASIIYYLEDLEMDSGLSLEDIADMFPKNPPPFNPNPYPTYPEIFGPSNPMSPQFPGTGDKIEYPWTTYCSLNGVKTKSYANGGLVTGKLSDGSLKNNEIGMLTFDQKRSISYLSKDDPACKNGLTRIVTEFNRPDILKSMEKLELRGRAYCLGFIASLCNYDMEKIDAVIKAYNEKIIHRVDIINEIINRNGSSFNVNSLVQRYK